ncbi:MAG: hypothetical protein PHT59_06135 [Candidatus Omnitrophica bacterium]|nr:hypothetical protein [Candidatus Omnitrophota bacterium]
MSDYARLFRAATGMQLSKRCADYRSTDAVDENIPEVAARLFFRDRKAFYALKEALERAAAKKAGCDSAVMTALGCMYYVDCDFAAAARCFREAIRREPEDLGGWFSLAFCYRQAGEDKKFDAIIAHYRGIIDEYRRKKGDIDALVLKHARTGRPRAASRAGLTLRKCK